MSNTERYLGSIKVISLLSRADRKVEISNVLLQHNLTFSFFDAVVDKDRPIIGCAKSHYNVLYDYYKSGVDPEGYFLVLEDDCVFVPDFLEKFNGLDLLNHSDWDSFRLGCMHTKRPISIDDGLVKCIFPLDAHAIIYKTSEIPKYLSLINKCIQANGMWDLYIAEQIDSLNIIAAYPNLAYQREGPSDIALQKYSNYYQDGVQKLYQSEIT